LKIIPCDSAYAWHTSSILCNQRTLGQNTQDVSLLCSNVNSSAVLVKLAEMQFSWV